jgi:hypothetical protein
VGGTSELVALLSFFTLSIVYKVWLKRNLNKGVERGRFSHFFLQLSISLGSHFLPPTLNLCFYTTCKSLHERGFNTFLQGNLQGGGVVFQTVEVLTTLEKMGSMSILKKVLLEHSVISFRVILNVKEIRELINGIVE